MTSNSAEDHWPPFLRGGHVTELHQGPFACLFLVLAHGCGGRKRSQAKPFPWLDGFFRGCHRSVNP
jgi:hypothetical protein